MAFKKSNFPTKEAVNFILADHDSASDFDSSDSEVSSEEFTDDDDDLNVKNQPLLEVAQRASCRTRGTINNFRRPGIWTIGGSNARMEEINDTKLRKEKKLEDSWSKIDTKPKIHEFTADTGLQVLFDPNTARNFSAHLRTDKSLCWAIYWNPVSNYTQWDQTLFSTVLLTGIVQKPHIKQFWRTNPLLQTASFNQVMARNRFTEILVYWIEFSAELFDQRFR